jgi:Histidine kinase-, DNA gyrase B-, and HSP90-like ATPase
MCQTICHLQFVVAPPVELSSCAQSSMSAPQGDRFQLQQVVLNLIMNAIEAMQSVAPRILSIRTCVTKPIFVHVAVEDTGTGIDPSNHDYIFKSMFTTKERGMGIGLSISIALLSFRHATRSRRHLGEVPLSKVCAASLLSASSQNELAGGLTPAIRRNCPSESPPASRWRCRDAP